MEVSALGFGVMGANYNRGVSPSREQVIGLIRQAAEHGVTLFDTAQIYGPLTNEKLAGEALAPSKDKVAITTKFGHKIVDMAPITRASSTARRKISARWRKNR